MPRDYKEQKLLALWEGKMFLINKQKTDHNHFKNCLTNCCDLKLLTVGCF